jgi:hypothetical protein
VCDLAAVLWQEDEIKLKLLGANANAPQSILVMMAVGRFPIHVVLVHLIVFQLSERWAFQHETYEEGEVGRKQT